METAAPVRGMSLPGKVRLPPEVRIDYEDRRRKRDEEVIMTGEELVKDPDTVRTDGSRQGTGEVDCHDCWG